MMLVLEYGTICMNKKHLKVLKNIYAKPTLSNVTWSDIESLFMALGGDISEGSGSRVRVKLNSVRAVFHRPHLSPDTDKGALSSVRRFLIQAGVKP